MALNPTTGNWTPDFGDWTGAGAAAQYEESPALQAELAALRTPTADFENMMAYMQPYRQFTSPMRSLGRRMQTRHMLEQPYMGVDDSFAQYLGSRLGSGGQELGAGLRPRLQLAGDVAATSVADMGQYAGNVPAMWYRTQFGPGAENQQQNQLAAASLLAQQRGGEGGGVYGGRMANAIRSAMGDIYSSRLAQGAPGGSFLQWYLGQTAPNIGA